LARTLESFGCSVDTVSGGQECLQALGNALAKGEPYQIALIDMQMPGMNGETTIRKIRENPEMEDLNIIVLTSMGVQGDATRFQELGCSGYLLKPVRQQELRDALLLAIGTPIKEKKKQLITRHTLAECAQSCRILLVEDNPINQKVAVKLLSKAGFSVDTANNGVEALQALQSGSYQMILMDVQMPEMDGFEATLRIRNSGMPYQDIPIIAMTAHALKGDREKCLEAGMNDYVSKPINADELFNVIQKWSLKESNRAESIEKASHRGEKEAGVKLIEEAAPTFDHALVEWQPFMDEFTIDVGDVFEETDSRSFNADEVVDLHDEQKQKNDPSYICLEEVLPRFVDDREFYFQILSEFLQNSQERLDEIKNTIDVQDGKQLNFLAHRFKGMAANLGAEKIAQIAQRLEDCGKQNEFETCPSVVNELEMEIRRLEVWFRGMKSELSTKLI
jgi:CheY-like chemotaxis protein/HPt (histidine-containing phosphotransfer) domain-containing protein